MSDLSEFENKYFIDGTRYNCPFCNVRAAKYSVIDRTEYNKDEENIVFCYIVQCDLCNNKSIHLSEWEFRVNGYLDKWIDNPFTSRPVGLDEGKFPEWSKIVPKLDMFFFYHFPTSFFTIDERIPKEIRELVSEAEGCKEMNFMVGASGALRKAIYKFLRREKAEGDKYEDKIKWLKTKYPGVDSDYFDVLAQVSDMNSQDLHEDDWEPFKSAEFNELIGATKAILHEIYVEPHLKKGLKDRIFGLKAGRVRQASEEPTEEAKG